MQQEFDVDIQWMPFELNPNIGPGGWSLPPVIRAKMADPRNPLFRMAEELGLPPLRHQDVVPTSRLALEATTVARDHRGDTAFKKAVFHRYWAKGEDISKLPVLLAAAEEAGVPTAAVEAAITGRTRRGLVDRLIHDAHALGIHAVPTTVLAGQFAVSGAQPYAVFERALQQLGVPRRRDVAQAPDKDTNPVRN